MAKRAGGVLICGCARSLVVAVARAVAADRATVIHVPPGTDAAAPRPPRSGKGRAAPILAADLGGDAAARRIVSEAWRAVGSLEAVVVCPLPGVAGTRTAGGLGDWNAAFAAHLRGPFFLLKHAAARLGRAGGGRIVVAMAAPGRAGSPIARVEYEAWRCLVDAFARAVPRSVAVATVVGRLAGKANGDGEIAESVGFVLRSEPAIRGGVIDLGAGGARG